MVSPTWVCDRMGYPALQFPSLFQIPFRPRLVAGKWFSATQIFHKFVLVRKISRPRTAGSKRTERGLNVSSVCIKCSCLGLFNIGPVRWSETWLKLTEKHCFGWIVVREKYYSGWKKKSNKPNIGYAEQDHCGKGNVDSSNMIDG